MILITCMEEHIKSAFNFLHYIPNQEPKTILDSSLINMNYIIYISTFSQDEAMEAALIESKVEYISFEEIYKEHIKTLNHILECNGLVEVDVPRDGNCWFAATVKMVKSCNNLLTDIELRSIVCDHMLEYEDHFKPFCDEHDFKEKVMALRCPGIWDTDLANTIPISYSKSFSMFHKYIQQYARSEFNTSTPHPQG